ncbi:MAG: NADH-quinone oxidoreductase subunit I, partial [Actinobacteria bacterium]|nr:NADH-quinone oxidoreductase subunit I [Actinomycetota bacterium]
MKVTLKTFFIRPVTVMYPYHKLPVPDRGQGLIRLRATQLEPEPRFKCTGCGICAKNCPQHCIEVVKMEKDKQPEIYTVNYGICMFCRICIDVCPFNALEQTQEYEFIGESREEFIRTKEQLMMKTVFVEPEKETNVSGETE